MISPLSLVCGGCGAVVDGPLPFRCPAAGSDGRDHVLARVRPGLEVAVSEDDPHPFVRYRRLLHSWQMAQAAGFADADYVALVRGLDREVAAIDGHGFAITPYRAAPKVAKTLDLKADGLWIKDETGSVAGSHKARHLFGLALSLEVAERAGFVAASMRARPLAIASCGNAALAAAVVARAARRSLRVFVPPSADAAVIARLSDLGASVETCPRRDDDPPGDPCHHRFREAAREGALPFTVQGSENGLAIDGGLTLAFELAEQGAGASATRLMIQVGGGALASAVIQGLSWSRELGAFPRLPAIHAVQTEGGFPLVRAWRLMVRAMVKGLGGASLPGEDLAVDTEAARADATAAKWLSANVEAAEMERAIHEAAGDRARYMWPWESEPTSAASGILDDETYDWLAVVRGMLLTGGWPVIAPESNILEAWCEGRGAGALVSATGAAGLAGAMTLGEAGLLSPQDHLAVLFTGVDRCPE